MEATAAASAEDAVIGVVVVRVVATDGEVAAGVLVPPALAAWVAGAVLVVGAGPWLLRLVVVAGVRLAMAGVVPAPLAAVAGVVVWGRRGGVLWATVGLVVAGGLGRVVLRGRVVVRGAVRGTGGGAVRRSLVPVISSSGSLRLLRLARRCTGTL